MSLPALLLVGGGGHCRAVIDVAERSGAWRIAGIVERNESAAGSVLGYPIVGTDADLSDLVTRIPRALVTVGQIRSPEVRIAIFTRLREAGFILGSVVSPLALVSTHAEMGDGIATMHFACIGPRARIGSNCIVNTGANIEHDCRVGPHCHISTGAILNGGVEVGEGAFVGSGSIVREGVKIGARCIVGMGVHVRADLPDGCRYLGERS